MSQSWIRSLIVLLAVAPLAACTTNKEKLLPHGDTTMLDIWNQQTGGSGGGAQAARQLLDARQALRRPLSPTDIQSAPDLTAAYSRTAQNEI